MFVTMIFVDQLRYFSGSSFVTLFRKTIRNTMLVNPNVVYFVLNLNYNFKVIVYLVVLL